MKQTLLTLSIIKSRTISCSETSRWTREGGRTSASLICTLVSKGEGELRDTPDIITLSVEGEGAYRKDCDSNEDEQEQINKITECFCLELMKKIVKREGKVKCVCVCVCVCL